MATKREKFSTFGAMMAMAGSAVGLGNLWRFPYLLGENGGVAFLVIYILCAFFIAMPIFFVEFIIGRRSGVNYFRSFSVLKPGTRWKWVGVLGVLTPLIILSYYCVIGGWSIEYLFKACAFDFSRKSTLAELSTVFSDYVSDIWPPIIGFLTFLGITAFIVSRGVKKGIEKFSNVTMPILFLLMIVMVIYVAFLPNAGEGYRYLFRMDNFKISPNIFSEALGQAFFSLSLGMGCIVTYSSYIGKNENIFAHCSSTMLIDLGFALIAACSIMPAVFAYNLNPGSGPSLVYETLPFIFSQMPAGNLIAILFFVALLAAAFTSSVSQFEVIEACLVEEKGYSRKKAIAVILVPLIILGTLCSLSFGPLNGFKILGKTLFEFFDKITANILMTVGALFEVLFVGWMLKRSDVFDEFTNGGTNRRLVRIFNGTYTLMRYIAPVAIVIILIFGFIW